MTWRQFERRQQAIEKEFIPKMEHAIRLEITKATEHFKVHGNGSILYSSVGIMTTLKELYHKAVHSEASIQYKKLKTVKLVGLGTNEAWNKVVETYLMQHNVFNTVEHINETTKKRVLQLISDGIQEGKSVDQIVAIIEADDIPLKRARLIVRTESVGAMNMGSMMGAISTGIMYQKKWVTAGDHRVRGMMPTDAFSHVSLNGELIDMEKPFNNGERIMFPGDKKGTSAGNFCNCRCCMSYVAKRDANGRIMRYPEIVPDKPGMSVGPDGKLSDLLFQIIMSQIFGNLVQDLIDNYANTN